MFAERPVYLKKKFFIILFPSPNHLCQLKKDIFCKPNELGESRTGCRNIPFSEKVLTVVDKGLVLSSLFFIDEVIN